ncbi:hypothetical protein [Austwickia sp. TVS 96-490-7B]|uniref:hypothetical protein n=1 Tax=Austwickia sp. TVS 96-490-7B TaxID=2830843 RepID=UPI001C595590|nr:hypothetical protein [Austwickia sp. TVS 96-490-7B]
MIPAARRVRRRTKVLPGDGEAHRGGMLVAASRAAHLEVGIDTVAMSVRPARVVG